MSLLTASRSRTWVRLVLSQVLLTAVLNPVNGDPDDTTEASKLTGEQKFSNVQICRSEECYRKASQFFTYMNKNVDPCDDFYAYACGNFEREFALELGEPYSSVHKLLKKKLKRDKMNILERLASFEYVKKKERNAWEPKFYQKIRNCFNSCFNASRSEGDEPLKEILSELKGWPVLGDVPVVPKKEMMKIVAKAGFTYQNIIYLYPTFEGYNSTNKVLGIMSPYLKRLYVYNEGKRDVVTEKLNLDKNCLDRGPTAELIAFGVNLAAYFGAEGKTVFEQMRAVAEFECKLFNITQEDELLQNVLDSLSEMGLIDGQSVQALLGGSRDYQGTISNAIEYRESALDDWDIESMLPPNTIRPDTLVTGERSPGYLIGLKAIFDTVDDKTFHNYLVYRVLRSLLPLATDTSADLDELLESIKLERDRRPRELQCLDFVDTRFEKGMAQLYLSRHATKALQEKLADMTFMLINTLVTIVARAMPWMDSTTKKKALEKLKNLVVTDAFVDEFRNPSKVDALLEQPWYDWNADKFILSEVRYQSYDRRFFEFNEKFDRKSWKNRLGKLEAEVFYDLYKNELFINSPITHFPQYSVSLPNYVNYGSLGWMIGHELTHAIDGEGRFFDKDGNLDDWWEYEMVSQYDKIATCFRKKYEKYFLFGQQVDANKTLYQNMADDLGANIAHLAWNTLAATEPVEEPLLPGFENMTQNQLFWISLASSYCGKYTTIGVQHEIASSDHAPNQFRVNGALSNNPEFARDFKCPVGAKMNPAQGQCETLTVPSER